MANFILNESLETPTPAWTFSSNALGRVNIGSSKHGSWAAGINWAAGDGSQSESWATPPLDTLTATGAYDLGIFVVDTGAAGDSRFQIQIDQGSGFETVARGFPASVPQTGDPVIQRNVWTSIRAFGVSITTLSPTVRFRVDGSQSGESSGAYLIDFGFMGLSMAVKLAERAVDAIVTSMVANFGTELSAIDTDRNDGVTLAIPASTDYHKHEKAEIAGSVAQVEVFESDFDFDNPYSDSDAQRAVYEVPVTVRLTCFNRDGDSATTMHKRKRRYAAGLFSVVNKNPRLVSPVDDAIQVAVVEGVETEIDRDAEDNISKVRATVRCRVRCEEVQ